jgi:hypothetical protein
MEQWELNKIDDIIEGWQKEEARRFAIAYAHLDERYAGYIQGIPQKVKVWHKEASEEELKALQKKYGWNKVASFNKGIFFTIESPYLSLDGYLTILSDMKGDVTITTEVVSEQLLHKLWVKATIKFGSSYVEGLAEVPLETYYDTNTKKEVVSLDKEGNAIFGNIEIPTSNAIRKAIAYLVPTGRFPIYRSDYMDHPMIKKFREFTKNETASK